MLLLNCDISLSVAIPGQPWYRETVVQTQAITIRLPVPVYEKLRLEAFQKRTSQVAIITEELLDRYDMTEEQAALGEAGA